MTDPQREIAGTKTPPKVRDWCLDPDDYKDLLRRASIQARGDKECSFVYDQEIRFETFGMNAFMTENQWNWLVAIADYTRKRRRRDA